ncbi:MAG: hypothetical protein JJ956_15990, partial [Pseudomonadales bacterium]|nr:hypothetical protein [Pseudomonadales bacterium]
MHPIEDVIDVKNVLVESWDDVLNTADEIEKLINDGLLWLEDETNLAKAKAALQTDIPDFSFEDPFPQYLVEQVLDLVKTKLEADIPETESAEAIFKLLIKKIPILPNVDLPGLSLSTLKSVLDRVVEEGFSISLEDLPARNEESTVRLSNRSRSKDEQDSLQILQSGNTGLFYDLLNELTTQFEAVWSAHGKDLESIMKDLDGFISQNDMNSLENSLKPIINQLKSGAISPEQLIEQLPIVLKQEGETALKGVRSAQPILAEAIGP